MGFEDAAGNTCLSLPTCDSSSSSFFPRAWQIARHVMRCRATQQTRVQGYKMTSISIPRT